MLHICLILCHESVSSGGPWPSLVPCALCPVAFLPLRLNYLSLLRPAVPVLVEVHCGALLVVVTQAVSHLKLATCGARVRVRHVLALVTHQPATLATVGNLAYTNHVAVFRPMAMDTH